MAIAKRRFGDISPNNPPQDGPATKTARTTLAPNHRLKECAICADDLPLKSFPPRLGHRTHNQRHSTCTACWQHHLTSEIATKPSTQIRCPQCPYALQEPDIKAHATPATYTAYLDKVLLETLQNDPNYRSCPSATCAFGYILTRDDELSDSIFNCRVCEAQYCVRCEVPMHKGVTCEEFQGQREQQGREEVASREFLESYAKSCPECGVRIRKEGGCDHMTCRRCQHEFCWLCFASYNGAEGIHRVGNGAHNQSCQYHPDRLPSAPSYFDDSGDETDYDALVPPRRRNHPTQPARLLSATPPGLAQEIEEALLPAPRVSASPEYQPQATRPRSTSIASDVSAYLPPSYFARTPSLEPQQQQQPRQPRPRRPSNLSAAAHPSPNFLAQPPRTPSPPTPIPYNHPFTPSPAENGTPSQHSPSPVSITQDDFDDRRASLAPPSPPRRRRGLFDDWTPQSGRRRRADEWMSARRGG